MDVFEKQKKGGEVSDLYYDCPGCSSHFNSDLFNRPKLTLPPLNLSKCSNDNMPEIIRTSTKKPALKRWLF